MDNDARETEEAVTARHYRETSGHPARWRRVYALGRNVTDEDPSTWPWPWRDDGRGQGRERTAVNPSSGVTVSGCPERFHDAPHE